MSLEYKAEDDLSSGRVTQPDRPSEGTVQKDQAESPGPPLGNGTAMISTRVLQRSKTNRM